MPLYTKQSFMYHGIPFTSMNKLSTSKRKQQEASASNTPTTMGTVPTPAELSQMLHDLGVTMGQLTSQVANLSTTANTSVHTAAQATKLAVAWPKPWNGKGGSVKA